jgi:hypothetical protein
MIEGSVMAAYLAATVVSKEDSRLTPAMSTALDRLRACVTAKIGAWTVAQLERQPPRAAALEAIGSELDVAARGDDALTVTSGPAAASSVKRAVNPTESAPCFVLSAVRFWPGTNRRRSAVQRRTDQQHGPPPLTNG